MQDLLLVQKVEGVCDLVKETQEFTAAGYGVMPVFQECHRVVREDHIRKPIVFPNVQYRQKIIVLDEAQVADQIKELVQDIF